MKKIGPVDFVEARILNTIFDNAFLAGCQGRAFENVYKAGTPHCEAYRSGFMYGWALSYQAKSARK